MSLALSVLTVSIQYRQQWQRYVPGERPSWRTRAGRMKHYRWMACWPADDLHKSAPGYCNNTNTSQYLLANSASQANSAFHPSGVSKWVSATAGKAKAGMAHSDCGWTCGCAGKTMRSLKNTCHTWVLLRWYFTKRRYIKYTYLYTFTFTDFTEVSALLYRHLNTRNHHKILLQRSSNVFLRTTTESA